MSNKKFIPANQGQGWFSQESIAQQQQMLSNIPGHVELSNRLLLEKEQQNALEKELERLNQENLLAEKNKEAVKEQEKQLAQQEKEAKEDKSLLVDNTRKINTKRTQISAMSLE